MSGRPLAPSYSVPTWASGNYGAGTDPWSATAKRAAPPGAEFTPGQKPAAQYLNYLFGVTEDNASSAKTDATNLLELVGQGPALNWPLQGTNTNNLSTGCYSTVDSAWFGVGSGGNDFLEVTYNGRTWTSLTGSLGAALALFDVSVNAAGTVAIVANSRTVYKGARTAYKTYTWTNTANRLSAAPSAARLGSDDVNGKFICVYRVGITGFQVDYIADPANAWTAATLSAAWTGYTGTNNPEISQNSDSAGTMIAAYVDAGTPRLNIMWSADGGATWTNVQKTLTMSAADAAAGTILSRPVWNSVRNEWYIAVGATSARKTEVYRSTDAGATWTLVANITSASLSLAFSDLACLGELITAVNDDGRILYSIDRGVSWGFSGAQVQGTSSVRQRLAVGGGGMACWHSGDKLATLSERFGLGV